MGSTGSFTEETLQRCAVENLQKPGHSKGNNVGKVSFLIYVSKDMKEITTKKNPTNVRNVGKPSIFMNLFKYMKGFILEGGKKPPPNVKNVGKPLCGTQAFKNT